MGGPHQTVGIFKSSVIGVMNGIVKREYIHNIIIIAPNLSHRPLGFLAKNELLFILSSSLIHIKSLN